MVPLLYALIAPVVGAFLYPILHDQPRLTRAFDRIMYVVVPLLVLIQVFGHEITHHGWKPVSIVSLMGAMALGLLMPIAIKHVSHGIANKTGTLSIIAGFLGLFLHALLEGASLNTDQPINTLPIAIHRIAVGVMIWWILRPRYGAFIAMAGIAGLLMTTASGFFLSGVLATEFVGSSHFQAFVAGSLLHVIFHESRHGGPHSHDTSESEDKTPINDPDIGLMS
ncbi:MAG: hypothetical protein OXL40_02755 [Bacteroidota bacterium]|nr:hypothetical protein [Bacteroidota bacterium]